jgi:hypothetical protein
MCPALSGPSARGIASITRTVSTTRRHMPARRQRLLDHGCPRFNLRLRISVTTAWPDLPISKSQQLRLAAFLKRNNFVGSSGFQSNHHHQPRGEWRAQDNLVLTALQPISPNRFTKSIFCFQKRAKHIGMPVIDLLPSSASA